MLYQLKKVIMISGKLRGKEIPERRREKRNMDNYYNGTIIITLVFMIIMLVKIMISEMFDRKCKYKFFSVFILIIFLAVLEWTGYHLERSSYRKIYLVLKACEFTAAPMVPLICVDIINSKNSTKKFLYIVQAFNAIMEVLSCFCGFIFSIDSKCRYTPGNFFFVYILIHTIGCLILVIECYRVFAHIQRRQAIIMVFALLLSLTGIIMQAVNNDIKTAYIAIALAASLFYITYSDVVLRTDALTGVLNRRSFDSKLSAIQENAILVNFDVDELKEVNETKGHSYGDACLETIAELIIQIFGKYGYCYRIDGDEFGAIIYKNFDGIEEMVARFHMSLEVRRKFEAGLPTVSTGYALFESEKISSRESFEEARNMAKKFKKIRKESKS